MPAMFAQDPEAKEATAPRLCLTRCPCQRERRRDFYL